MNTVTVELRPPRGYLQPAVVDWPAGRLPEEDDAVTLLTYSGKERWRVGRIAGWEVRPVYDHARGRATGAVEVVLVVELADAP